MGPEMSVLFYLAVSIFTCNCQPTAYKCDHVEPNCASLVYDNTANVLLSRLAHIENELQKGNEERNLLKSEIASLKEQLNNVSNSLIVKPSDCADLHKSGHRISGVYKVYPTDLNNSKQEVEVYCDMTTSGGGWTVFQKRYDGSISFQSSWEEYKYGFGNITGELWLGNKYISMMTSSVWTKYRLRVDLKAFDGQTRYAEYADFKVAPESEKYRLNIGTYSGTAGDGRTGLTRHNNQYFSTRDRDNDQYSGHCSRLMGYGGFWYQNCHVVNLNGVYSPTVQNNDTNIRWGAWRPHESLQATSMMFRPMNCE